MHERLEAEDDRLRTRVDELTIFYQHLNSVVLNMIGKFDKMDGETNRFMKSLSLAPPVPVQPLT